MSTNKVLFDFKNIKTNAVGKYGISEEEFEKYKAQSQGLVDWFDNNAGFDMMEWVNLPYNQDEVILDMENTAKNIREDFEYFVVLGIGGSALGTEVIFESLCDFNHNLLPLEKRKNAPKFFIVDNVDPDKMASLFEMIDLSKTMFNVVTKSGTTCETLTLFLYAFNKLSEIVGEESAYSHFTFTTDITKGYLAEIAKEHNIKCFHIPKGVGGRFSVLSPVGLFPASVLGIDIKEMLNGARSFCDYCKGNKCNIALTKALIDKAFFDKGIKMNVIMPYSEKLKAFTSWYSQLMSESIGKEIDNDGNVVNVGITPVRALGVTDQHSQQQLYIEGCFDKVITFIQVEKFSKEVNTGKYFHNLEDLQYLQNLDLSKLMNIELSSTRYALTKHGRPNNTIYMSEINEYTLGKLFTFSMIEIAYLGKLFNINAFNQSGVEHSKVATFAFLNRKGYENLIDLEDFKICDKKI